MVHVPRGINMTVMDADLRGVTCEHCGSQYAYVLGRRVSQSYRDEDKTDRFKAKLEETIRKRANREVKKGIDPVACPDCGYLQRAMVRDHRSRGLGVIILCGIISGLLIGGLALGASMDLLSMIVPVCLAAVSLALLSIAVFVVYSRDWNSRDRIERRLQNPGRRTLRRKDLPDLAADLFSDKA